MAVPQGSWHPWHISGRAQLLCWGAPFCSCLEMGSFFTPSLPPSPSQGDVGDLGLPGLPGPKVLCLGWGFLGSLWQTGGRDVAWGGHLAREWGGGCCCLGSSQCHSSRVHGPADPTKDAHWAPGSLPWLCSRHCRLRKWAGKLRGVFQDTEESFLGGCPCPTGKHPIFCASLSPACLLQLPSTLHPQGRK